MTNAQIADAIAAHLPYLRRFARAISGSQKSGDAYVVELLEMLVEDPSAFRSDVPPRIMLFRLFVRLWNSVSVNVSERSDVNPVTRSLSAITPPARQAFLLTSIEGFSTRDVAAIMEVRLDEVEALIQKAADDIVSQVATDVLIIEDEPLIALDLEQIVTSLGHTVTATVKTHAAAVDAVNKKRPGLMLADIQLADGSSGLEAVNEILSDIDVPVIFITAYPESLLSGEKPEPAFLLTKPYDSGALKALISQALFFDMRAEPPRPEV